MHMTGFDIYFQRLSSYSVLGSTVLGYCFLYLSVFPPSCSRAKPNAIR
jgi:hypothetical protein